MEADAHWPHLSNSKSSILTGDRTLEIHKDMSPAQEVCAKVLNSAQVETLIGCCVMCSFILMVMESDAGTDIPTWMNAMNLVLLLTYVMETVIRIFVCGLSYFRNAFHFLDLLIIVVDALVQFADFISGNGIPSLAALRMIRLLRLARGVQAVMRCPQLALMVKALAKAATASLYGVLLLLVIVTIWSVAAVQLIHPINQRVSNGGAYEGCARCEQAFSNVRNSMLTFVQQIIAGDSWGLVTIPIMEEAPETTVFFAMVFVSVHFTIMNVILAVIVDSALQASTEDVKEKLNKKNEDFERAAQQLKVLCEQMDKDDSGDLTEEELSAGYRSNDTFRDLLRSMDVKEEDMHTVFKILDSSCTGSVDYKEFVENLFKIKSHDSHTMLVFIQHFVMEIRRDVRNQMQMIQDDVIDKICSELLFEKGLKDSDNAPTLLEEKQQEVPQNRREILDNPEVPQNRRGILHNPEVPQNRRGKLDNPEINMLHGPLTILETSVPGRDLQGSLVCAPVEQWGSRQPTPCSAWSVRRKSTAQRKEVPELLSEVAERLHLPERRGQAEGRLPL